MIQRDIVYAKAPDEVLDVSDVFLMGLGGKEGFEEPLTIVNLRNLSHLLEGSNTLFHDWYFRLAIADLLNGDGGSTSSVNDTLVMSHGDKSATLIEHTPVFFDQSCEACTLLGLQVGQIKFLLQALAMLVFGMALSNMVPFGPLVPPMSP